MRRAPRPLRFRSPSALAWGLTALWFAGLAATVVVARLLAVVS